MMFPRSDRTRRLLLLCVLFVAAHLGRTWMSHDPWRDLALSLLALVGVLVIVWMTDRHLDESLGRLERAVVRFGKGDFQRKMPSPPMPEVERVATAVEHAGRRVAQHIDELTRAKQTLSDELAQARARLQDPVRDRRRDEVLGLKLSATLQVGRVSGAADVMDFWLDFAVLAVDRDLAKQLVPGQPVSIVLTSPDGTEMSGEATAQACTHEQLGSRVAWSFGWTETVAPADLWPPLWHAINPRRDLRVSPRPHDGVRAILHVDDRIHQAQVLDLSRAGIGVLVTEALDRLGGLGQSASLAITLDLPGHEPVRARVQVKSLETRSQGTRLGLALDTSDPVIGQAMGSYLAQMRPDVDEDAALPRILPPRSGSL